MAETAPSTLYNVDPTLQESLAVPYETERGTAYSALDMRTGEALSPPSGVSVEIYDEWAAQEVTTELGVLNRFLAGEQIETEPGVTLSATTILEGLSNLAMLHIGQEQVDAIDSFVQINGPGDDDRRWRWQAGKVADTVAESQIRILSNLMPGNKPLKHFTAMGTPLLLSGALRPKASHDEYRSLSGDNYLLKAQGSGAVRHKVVEMVAERERQRSTQENPNLRYRGYPAQMGLHSQLVHFSERDVRFPATDTTTLFYPRSKVIDRTPIVMVGQDASGSTGVAGVRNGGDEAHHGLSEVVLRDRFARVHVDIAPELQDVLSQRHESVDVTFMAATDDAEKAVDFEYPIEDAVVFVSGSDIRRLIETTVNGDQSDTLIPESVMEQCRQGYDEQHGLKKDDFDLQKFTYMAERVKDKFNKGEVLEFKSPRSEAFWHEMIEEINTLVTEIVPAGQRVGSVDQGLIIQTAIIRRVLRHLGHNEAWVNHNVFATANRNDSVNFGAHAERTASEWISNQSEGIDYIQARSERLRFDQLDLLTQLPVYKS